MRKKPKLSLELRRVVKAPCQRVYQAWTDPAQLKQWFGPEWVKTREFVADVRVGGTFRWDLIDCDGKQRTHEGEYRELVPNRKIVFTWSHAAWEGHKSIVTIELSPSEGGTELHLRQELLPTEAERDAHREGWSSVLNKLEEFCAR